MFSTGKIPELRKGVTAESVKPLTPSKEGVSAPMPNPPSLGAPGKNPRLKVDMGLANTQGKVKISVFYPNHCNKGVNCLKERALQ